jgi:uncharacterized protein involved in exopolysaccharide biosynthesis
LYWLEGRAILWARRRLFLGLLTLLVLCGASTLLWRVPLYEASLRILLLHDDAASSALPAEALYSEMQLLQSRVVWEAVAQELSLSERDFPALVSRLAIAPVENSHVIQATYRAASPEQAAKFLNTLFQQYSTYRQSLHSPAHTDVLLRDRSATFNQKIEAASAALQKLSAQHGRTLSSGQQELLLKQYYEVQKQAEAAQLERQELEQRRRALHTQLAAQPEQVETGSITKYGAALDKLKEELAALEMQRTQLQQKYQPHHRLLRDQEQRIAQVKTLIAQEEQNPPRERSFARNETRYRLQDEWLQAEAQLAALAEREQRLSTLAREYQTKLAAFNVQSFIKDQLERERALNEEAWRLFEKKAQEVEINAVLQQANGLQVRLLEPASSHPYPTNQPRWGDWAGLFLLGLVVAGGSTILVESLHPRLRHEAGLQRRLGLPVLASLPPQRESHSGNDN